MYAVLTATWVVPLLVAIACLSPDRITASVTNLGVIRQMSKPSATAPFNQNMTLNLRVGGNDMFNGATSAMSVTGANGARAVTLTGNRIVTKFRVIVKTFVPERAQQEIFSQYIQPDNIGANQTNAGTFTDAMGRQLLSAEEMSTQPRPPLRKRIKAVPHYPSLQLFLSDLEAIGNPANRHLLQLDLLGSVGDTITCGAQGVARKIFGAIGIHTDPSVQCSGAYASQQDMINLTGNLTATTTTLQNFITNQTSFDADTTAALQSEQNTTNFLLSYSQHNYAQVQEIQTQATATAHALYKFQGQVAQNFTFVQGEIQNVTNRLVDFGVQLRQTTLNLQVDEGKMLDMIGNITRQLNNAINTLNGHIGNVAMTADKRFLQLSDALSGAIDMTIDSINQSPLKTGNILLSQTRFQAIREDASMDIFLTDQGAAAPNPLTLTKTTANVICDVLSQAYMWTNPVGGTPMMTVTNYTWWCSKTMLNARVEATNWVQIMNKMGPTNCSTVFFGEGRCNSWMEVSEQQAVMVNTANTPNATILAHWKGDYSYIPGEFVQGGAGNIVNGANNGVIIKGSDGFFSTQESICSRGSRNDFDFYRIKSFRNKWHSKVPYHNAACAGGNLRDLMEPPPEGPFTIMYAMVIDMQFAYQQSMYSINATTVVGRNAGDMTWNFEPFARINAGDSSAMHVLVMTFSPRVNMVPIYKIEKVSTTVKLNVQVDGGPVQVYDGIIDADATNDLFPSGTYLAGNPYTGFAGEDYIYDIASSEIVPSIFTKGECGRIDYNGVADPTQFDIQYWMNSNGIRYDHECGAASLHAMREMIDPDPDNGGRCLLPLNANSNGDLCAQLERYKIEPDSIHETLNFVHRLSSATFEITVPDGDLAAVFQSICPDILTIPNSDFSFNMRLQNPVNAPNKIRAIQTGGCPQTYDDIDLSPLAFDSFSVTSCPDTPVGQSEIITFYTINTDGDITGVCNAVNASVKPGDAVLQPTPVTANLTETWRTVTTKSTQYMFHSIAEMLLRFRRNIALSTFKQFTIAGIGMPPESFSNLTADIALDSAELQQIQNLAATEQGAQFQYGEFADYDQLIANSTARSAEDAAAAAIDLANAASANAATLARLDRVQSDLAAVQNSAAAFQNASNSLLLLLQQIHNEGVPDNPADCNNNFLTSFFCNIGGDIGAAGSLLGNLLDNPLGWLFKGLGGSILQIVTMAAAFGGLALGLYAVFGKSSGGGSSGGGGTTVVQQPQMQPQSQPIQYQPYQQQYDPRMAQQQMEFARFQQYLKDQYQSAQQQQQMLQPLRQRAEAFEQTLSPVIQKVASTAPIPSEMANRMVAAVMPTPAPPPPPMLAPSPVSVPVPMRPIAIGAVGTGAYTGIGTPAPSPSPTPKPVILKVPVDTMRAIHSAAKISVLSRIPEAE